MPKPVLTMSRNDQLHVNCMVYSCMCLVLNTLSEQQCSTLVKKGRLVATKTNIRWGFKHYCVLLFFTGGKLICYVLIVTGLSVGVSLMKDCKFQGRVKKNYTRTVSVHLRWSSVAFMARLVSSTTFCEIFICYQKL